MAAKKPMSAAGRRDGSSGYPDGSAMRRHRVTFLAAGVYNVLWGLYAVVDPQWLFRVVGMPPSNTPQIFACLGMVLGLYGLLYFEVARRPEAGWPIAAVGLTGKVLGPARPGSAT